MPRPSATFTVWASAWLVGAAAPDDVLDALAPWADAHDVQAADELAAATTNLPLPGAPVSSLPFLLAALRRAAPRSPARLVLPAPGDVRGLPGPGPFSREATAAGEGVLFADIGLGVVPTPIADGVVRWTVYRVPEPGPAPEFVALSHAERDLRDQVRRSASVLTDLGVARHRPGCGRRSPRPCAPAPPRSGPRVCPRRCCGCCSRPTRWRPSCPPPPSTSPAARCPRRRPRPAATRSARSRRPYA